MGEKRRLCRIRVTFYQFRVLGHLAHDQSLHRDQSKAVHQSTGLLLHKILIPMLNAPIDERHEYVRQKVYIAIL